MARHRSAVIPEDVSAALRLARKQRAMSMDRAARAAGISTSLWTQVEGGTQYKRGQKVPASTTAETLQAMASAVGLDAGFLLARAGLDPAPETPPEPSTPAGIVDLSGLSENDLHSVAGFIAGLRAARRG